MPASVERMSLVMRPSGDGMSLKDFPLREDLHDLLLGGHYA